MHVNDVLIIIQRESCPQKKGFLKVPLFTFWKTFIYLGWEDRLVNNWMVIKIVSRWFSTSYPHFVDNFM